MEFETGKFKRYVRNRDGKEVIQVGVSGLSVNSKFKDGEEIIVLSKEEGTQLENQLTESNNKVKRLTQQLKNPTYNLKV